MRRRLLHGLLLPLVPWVGVGVGVARAQTDELLGQVLSAVARRPLEQVPFYERRSSAMFNKPAESRGTLSFRAPDRFEKTTTTPIRERLVIVGNLLTLQALEGGEPRTVNLDEHPQVAGAVQSIRAILAGDPKPLRQHFEVRLTGVLSRWQMTLLPKEPALKRLLRQVVVSGEGGQVKVLETTETSGDVTELTLLAGPTVKTP